MNTITRYRCYLVVRSVLLIVTLFITLPSFGFHTTISDINISNSNETKEKRIEAYDNKEYTNQEDKLSSIAAEPQDGSSDLTTDSSVWKIAYNSQTYEKTPPPGVALNAKVTYVGFFFGSVPAPVCSCNGHAVTSFTAVGDECVCAPGESLTITGCQGGLLLCPIAWNMSGCVGENATCRSSSDRTGFGPNKASIILSLLGAIMLGV